MRLKSRKIFSFLLIPCIMLTACAAPAVRMPDISAQSTASSPETVSLPTIYQVPLSSSQYNLYAFVSPDGKEIMRGDDIFILSDELTDVPVALMQHENIFEYDEEYDEYYELSSRVRLFSLDGTLLRDWEDGFYYMAFGRYVWRLNFSPRNMEWSEGPSASYGDVSELVDIYTGEVKLSNIGNLVFFYQDGVPLLAKYTIDDTLQSVMDTNLKVVADLSSSPYMRIWPDSGYYEAYKEDFDDHYILDSSFQPIFSESFTSSYLCGPGFFKASVVKDGVSQNVILDIENTKMILLSNLLPDTAFLEYFDGKKAVAYDDTPQNFLCLYRPDGTLLASGFREVEYPTSYSRVPFADTHLYAIKEDTLYAVASDGAFAYTSSFPVSSISEVFYGTKALSGECLSVYLPSGNITLLNEKLQPVLPKPEYKEIRILACGAIAAQDVETELYNIFSPSGQLLIKDLDQYFSDYTMTIPNRFIGIRGNSVILMDEGGNWIWHETYERSKD